MKIPSSKSLTHRALFCAAMAHGKSTLINPLKCSDTLASVEVLTQLGIRVEMAEEKWIVYGGAFRTPSSKIFCNESGTTYRFVTALTDRLNMECEITGEPSLLRRPQRPSPQVSSQYISGAFLAAPLDPYDSLFQPKGPLVSKQYIALTLAVQKKFGVIIEANESFSQFFLRRDQYYRPTEFVVEADWSSAAFLLAAGVLKKKVIIENLNRQSLQADRKIVEQLLKMGGNIHWDGETLIAEPSTLTPIDWDMTDTPDLYPIASVLNFCAGGGGKFFGTERLKEKESNRLNEMEKVLNQAVVDSNDHRIIMAGAVLELATGKKMEYRHPEGVEKSFPVFWDAIKI